VTPSNARQRELVAAMQGRRVVVLADLVADEYVLCRTDRISREAPAALILRHEGRELRPGGGANTAANLRALGAQVDLVGVVGDDPYGDELRARLLADKIEIDAVAVERSYRTVVKSRVLTCFHHSTRQQVLRIDREDTIDAGSDVAAAIAEAVQSRLGAADALLVSDYGYGAAAPSIVRPALDAARAAGLPVALDSRHRILEYAPVATVTPNEPEVEEALGVTIGDDLEQLSVAGSELLTRLQAEAVLVTRGSRGMALFERDREMELIPVHGSDEIADVTGAGDTVIAAYTLAPAAGARHAEAARLANVAGGVVVLKMGTAIISADELALAIRDSE